MSFSEMGFYEWVVVTGIFIIGAGIFIISVYILAVDTSLGKINTRLNVISHDVEKIMHVAQWDEHPNTRHLERLERTVCRVEEFLGEYMLTEQSLLYAVNYSINKKLEKEKWS